MPIPAVVGVIAKKLAVDAAVSAVNNEGTYSTIQNTAGTVSLATAFAAAAGVAAAPVAATLGASLGTTAILGTVGVALGASCLPLAVAAGTVWAGMWAIQAMGARESLGKTLGTALSFG